MQQIAGPPVDATSPPTGTAAGAHSLDMPALFARHESDCYELYARHGNEQLVRMLKMVGYDVGFCRGEGQYLFGRNGARYLDLCGPATLTINAQGGEITFGALEAGLEVEYARDAIGFCWAGCEEGDEVEGEGAAELRDDGTIEIKFADRNGDEAVLRAKRDTSSTAR